VAGVLVAENRVAAATSTTVTMLYATSIQATDLMAFGVIPSEWRLLAMRHGADGRKFIARIYIEHAVEASAALLRIDTTTDTDAEANKGEIDLTNVDGRSLLSTEDNAFFWKIRGSQRYPAMDYSITGITMEVKARKARAR